MLNQPIKHFYLAEPLISRLSYNHYYVIGHAGIDMYAAPNGIKIEDATTFIADLGNAGGNICVALCQLGANASLLTQLSNDAIGRFTRNRLLKHDVDIAACRFESSGSSSTLAFYDSDSTIATPILFHGNADGAKFNDDDIRQIPFVDIGGLIISGSKLLSKDSRKATLVAMHRAHKQGVPVIFDLVHPIEGTPDQDELRTSYQTAISVSNIVFGSEKDYAFVAGPSQSALMCAQNLPKSKSTFFSVYKMGDRGSQTFTQKGVIRTRAFNTSPEASSSSAGHAFLAGIMAALSEQASLTQALLQGSATAALSLTSPGSASAMPSRMDVNSFLRMKTNDPTN